jgi:predicted Holliday junction resolvase-like endonuclease
MNGQSGKQALVWVLLVMALALVVGIEGYYIFALRDIIERQSEELKQTSIQIQNLRHERSSLEEELHMIKNTAGEKENGNSPERQH